MILVRMDRFYVVTCVLAMMPLLTLALRGDECEVCVKFTQRFRETLTDKDLKSIDTIVDKFKDFCKDAVGKENRFCYYLGGSETSATGMVRELAKPLSFHAPTDVVCEKLKKVDSQICDLRYDKEINWKEVNLKKLKVRDLRKILGDWGEMCDGCIEKTDFIKRIEELKPKYVREEL